MSSENTTARGRDPKRYHGGHGGAVAAVRRNQGCTRRSGESCLTMASQASEPSTSAGCFRCGRNHSANVCPYKDYICNSCHGSITYYNRFIRNLPDILHPLYQLLKKDVSWLWDKKCQDSFEYIKNALCSDDVLVHYNPDVPVTLTIDSSDYGIGAILSHVFDSGVERPICYASRTLSKNELAYSTLDKEATAIVWSIKRFYQYLWGRNFTLVTDNKALISIFGPKSGVPVMAANRLQRYAHFLSGFNFKIKHVPSIQNVADFLSRMPIEDDLSVQLTDFPIHLNYLTNSDSSLPIEVNKVRQLTASDPVLSKILKFVKGGWPANCVDNDLKPYFSRKNEINTEDDVLIWGYRVIIPLELRGRLLKELHSTHLGIVKMKLLARSYFWWPSLNNDIENVSKNCEQCQRVQLSPPKAPLQCWPIPDGIWSRIHIDFFEPSKNNFFLIVIDAFSKWLEVFPMSSITANMTITKLRELFSRFGLPKTIASDNGPQLVSEEFKQFAKSNGIKLITIPPYEPHCNGAAENSVRTVKNFLKKVCDKKNINVTLAQFLLTYRNTVHCSTGYSPAKVFLGRSLRTRFDMLRPSSIKSTEEVDHQKVFKNIQRAQQSNKKYFSGRRKLRLKLGQIIMVKDYRNSPVTWCKGKVVKILGKNVYLVQPLDANIIWKRHTNQLRELDDDYLLLNARNVDNSHNSDAFSNSDCDSVISVSSSVDEVFLDAGAGAGVVNNGHSDVPDSEPNSSSVNGRSVPVVSENRPKRARKPPERFQFQV
nr:unnamed protein product [Callosobruchus analis]